MRDLLRQAGGRRPALALAATLVLTACDGLRSDRQVIVESGGQTIVLENGVCLEYSTTAEEDKVSRVARSRCGL
ncbi:MAG: hypothetical protein AAFV19_21835 [Pseudomonadota bacterium]